MVLTVSGVTNIAAAISAFAGPPAIGSQGLRRSADPPAHVAPHPQCVERPRLCKQLLGTAAWNEGC
jgi:hypothetical protein